MGRRSDRARGSAAEPTWTDRLRLILVSALQIDKAVFFSTAIIVAAFIPLFTMQGVEGQIFSPMARTYGYALVGALIATFTVTPCLASLLLPEHVSEVETFVVRALRAVYTPVLRWSLGHRKITVAARLRVSRRQRACSGSRLGSEFLPALEEGNLWIRAAMPPTISLEAGMPIRQPDPRDPAAASGGDHRRVPARPPGQRQRRRRLLQRRVLRAAQAVRRVAGRT